MNHKNFWFLVAFCMAIQTLGAESLKAKAITIKTNDPDVVAEVLPLSVLEARELFGSTGPLDSTPQDKYTFAKRALFLSNGFSNLHGRYLVGKVSIKNNTNGKV